MSARLRDALTSFALVASIAFTLVVLTACGGGGDSEGKPDQGIERPNCAASGVCS